MKAHNKIASILFTGFLAGCSTQPQLDQGHASSANAAASSSDQYEVNVALEDSDSLGLATSNFSSVEVSLECAGLAAQNFNTLSFNIPAGSKGCKVRLKSFGIASGSQFKVDKDFTTLVPGSVAQFRLGTSRIFNVSIKAQLPDVVNANSTVSFKASELTNSGNIVAAANDVVTSSGSVDTPSNLIPHAVTLLPTGVAHIILRCADGDVMGADVASATCYNEKIADHIMAFVKSNGKTDFVSMQSVIAGSGKGLVDLKPSFASIAYQAGYRRMLAIDLPVDLKDKTDRIIAISLKTQTWIRYRTVKMP